MKSFKKFVEDAKYEAYVLKNLNSGLFLTTATNPTSGTRDLNKAYQYHKKDLAKIQQNNLLKKDVETEIYKVKVDGPEIELA